MNCTSAITSPPTLQPRQLKKLFFDVDRKAISTAAARTRADALDLAAKLDFTLIDDALDGDSVGGGDRAGVNHALRRDPAHGATFTTTPNPRAMAFASSIASR